MTAKPRHILIPTLLQETAYHMRGFLFAKVMHSCILLLHQHIVKCKRSEQSCGVAE